MTGDGIGRRLEIMRDSAAAMAMTAAAWRAVSRSTAAEATGKYGNREPAPMDEGRDPCGGRGQDGFTARDTFVTARCEDGR